MVRAVQFLVLLVVFAAVADADNVFNMPTGQTSLEFVTVGDANNTADTRYIVNPLSSRQGLTLGSVPYEYQIGKYDVTVAQYVVFLNAVAKTDTFRVFTSGGLNILQSGTIGNYSYSVGAGFENKPIGVSWNSAARFVNWLHNGQPSGPQSPSTTESGVYELQTIGQFTLNGDTVTRNPGATYFIPSEDEWYKAAYYKGGGANSGYWTYATQSDNAPSNEISATGTNNANYSPNFQMTSFNTTPVGAFASSPSYYGTFDQSGNVWNKTEGQYNFGRALRGGDFSSSADEISAAVSISSGASTGYGGFRVAAVAAIPEPSSVLVAVGALSAGLYVVRRRKRV